MADTDLLVKIRADIGDTDKKIDDVQARIAAFRTAAGRSGVSQNYDLNLIPDYQKMTAELESLEANAASLNAQLAELRSSPVSIGSAGLASGIAQLEDASLAARRVVADINAAHAATKLQRARSEVEDIGIDLGEARLIQRRESAEITSARKIAQERKKEEQGVLAASLYALGQHESETKSVASASAAAIKGYENEQISSARKIGQERKKEEQGVLAASLFALRKHESETKSVASASAAAIKGYHKELAESGGKWGDAVVTSAEKSSRGMKIFGIDIARAAYNFRVLVDEWSSGQTSRMTGSTIRVMEQFAAGNPILMGLTVAAGTTAVTFGYLQVQAYKASVAIKEMSANAAGLVNLKDFGGTSGLVEILSKIETSMSKGRDFWDYFGKGAALAHDEAQKVVDMVAAIPDVSPALIESFDPLARAMKTAFPDDFQTRLKPMVEGLANVTDVLPGLIEKTNNLSDADKAEGRAALESGNVQKQRAALLQIYDKQVRNQIVANIEAAASGKKMSDAQRAVVKEIEGHILAGKELSGVVLNYSTALRDAFGGDLKSLINESVQSTSDLGKAVENVKNEAGKAGTALRDAFDLSGKIGGPIRELEQLDNKIAILERGSAPGTLATPRGSEKELAIRTAIGEAAAGSEEGWRAVLEVIRNRQIMGTYPGGTDLTSIINAKEQFMGAPQTSQVARGTISDEKYAKLSALFDEVFSGLSDTVHGATNFRAGDVTRPWQKIKRGGNSFGNESGDQEEVERRLRVRDSLREEEGQKKRLTDTAKGGNEIDRAGLEILERTVVEGEDQLRNARDRLAAAQRERSEEAARGADAKKLNDLQKTIDTESIAVKKEEFALEKSKLDLKKAGAVTDKEKLAIAKEQRALDVKSGGFAPGTKQDVASKTALAQSQTAADAAELRRAVDMENERFAIEKGGFQRRIELLREEARVKQLTKAQEIGQEASVNNQIATAEAAHFEKLKALYSKDSQEYSKFEAQKVKAHEAALTKIYKNQLAVQSETFHSYQQTFQQIGSSISSSIMGMITGQMKLRDAVRNIATQIVNMFVQAGVKMAMNWLASIASQTAATVTGETAKTAAVTAGVSARTAAQTTGNAASMVGVLPGVLKSIFASAGETFAGIFGFLSPVMGPAAAGPAAAGQATVAAVAGGLAVGAWQLPSDMIVKAHQGEMVVPAGVTPWVQGMLAAGGATGGGHTVHVHHSTSFNVSAMDSRSVHAFFKDHGKTIMRTINESVRTGAHLGLSKISA